jgi:hypothetical protein
MERLHFSHHYTVSLVLWVNRLLPALGGSGSFPWDAPILLELRSAGSDVMPQGSEKDLSQLTQNSIHTKFKYFYPKNLY